MKHLEFRRQSFLGQLLPTKHGPHRMQEAEPARTVQTILFESFVTVFGIIESLAKVCKPDTSLCL